MTEKRSPGRTTFEAIAIIGAHEHAAVQLTGWFAPKVAALFERHAQSYTIRPGPGGKLMVNQGQVIGSTVLKNGDVIEVAALKMTYSTAPGNLLIKNS